MHPRIETEFLQRVQKTLRSSVKKATERDSNKDQVRVLKAMEKDVAVKVAKRLRNPV